MRLFVDSLNGRFILASALILPIFLGATGYYLDQRFISSTEAAEAERLQLHTYALLAEAEYESELFLPQQLLEPRFNQLSSGLYAFVLGGRATSEREQLWQSGSVLASEMTSQNLARHIPALKVGESFFGEWQSHYFYGLQVEWQQNDTAGAAELVPLLFVIVDAARPLMAERASYRQGLWTWLGGAAFLLLFCQGLALRWGLRPLQTLSKDLKAVEVGDEQQLPGDYPAEVQQVTDNLNALLSSEQPASATCTKYVG